MRILWMAAVGVMLWAGAAYGQSKQPVPSPFSDQTTQGVPSKPGSGINLEDGIPGRVRQQQAIAQNGARQKKLAEDTARLLALATELKQQVDKTDKNILSVDVIKKADEIEKLAKSVKDRMRGSGI